jgi:MFS transporter, PAT family, beta-lactamase induction signal transducer AmpG
MNTTKSKQDLKNTSFFKNPKTWCFTTYFTEGLPYMIIRSMSFVFFTDIGMKERYLGYLNFLGLPWNLKLLWAPFVEIFGRKRSWIIGVQIAISIMTAAVALICFVAGHSPNPSLSNSLLALVFVVLAFIAATNDIAIDGYYMEGITDPGEQAAYTGYRVFAYRLSMILARFGFINIAAYAAQHFTKNLYIAWGYAFLAAAGTMLLFTLYHVVGLPEFQAAKTGASGGIKKVMKDFVTSFAAFLEITYQRTLQTLSAGAVLGAAAFVIFLLFHIPWIQSFAYAFLAVLIVLLVRSKRAIAMSLIIIIFYKIGDEILFSMGTPFLMRELHVTKAQIALMAGLVGALGSIAGTAIGGIWIKKKGLEKAVWPLTLLMNLNIWAYIGLAYFKPTALTFKGLAIISSVYCYEQIAAGLGNAVLIVFILRTCKKEFKAAHYAIGSAFMSLFSTVFGGFSGIIVEKTGYLNLFLISFFASVPSMVLLLFSPVKDEKKA